MKALPTVTVVVAYEGGHKVAEIYSHRRGFRVFWPSSGAVDNFITQRLAKLAVEEPFTRHGRTLQWTTKSAHPRPEPTI